LQDEGRLQPRAARSGGVGGTLQGASEAFNVGGRWGSMWKELFLTEELKGGRSKEDQLKEAGIKRKE
jgi:hypothetical protein